MGKNGVFSNAPLSKLSLLFVGSTSFFTSLYITDPTKLNRLLCMDVNRIKKYSEIWRFLTHQLLFSSTGELILGSILLYYFRLFERQMGSRKFGSFITVVSVISSIVEYISLLALNPSLDQKNSKPMIGPYPLIYAFFVLYFLKVPRLHPKLFSVAGIDISDKTLMYIAGFQLMFSNGWSSLIPSLSGMIAGILYCLPCTNSKRNPLQKFRLPKFLCRMGNFFRPLLVGGGSTSNGRQNTQPYRGGHMTSSGNSSSVRGNNDSLNNARYRHTSNGNNNTNTPERLIDARYSRGAFNGGGFLSGFGVGGERRVMGGLGSGIPSIPPSEDQISSLMALGFDRADCIRALEQSGNNVDAAADRLLR